MNKILLLIVPMMFMGGKPKDPEQDLLNDTVIQSEILLSKSEQFAAQKQSEFDVTNDALRVQKKKKKRP
jgi:hypothetical protein